MRYLRDIPEPGMGTWYFEIDAGGTAFRQIVLGSDGSSITSNRKHGAAHFVLAEHPLNPEEPYYEEISREEFEGMWHRQLQKHGSQWKEIQKKFPVGTAVEGYIECFYPQGTLVNLLEEGAVGLANTSSLSASASEAWMYPRHIVQAEVTGYDEVNHWVLLDHAQILKNQYEEKEGESGHD
ncbi:hypothetical protein Q5741_15215 [Paenibacillus sp. JX-17]|uniref:S1 motif domain-containing protein n=1 Tax=Paenibacillus lacisoli TaxID=3064525 RepID=A0ABT9CER0_9BACL|nr:hypothetical protein [Paenibacillus sp. JX-17]MDO7907760.1 hypothetical protein [Paenibacillus sp. JX-17]